MKFKTLRFKNFLSFGNKLTEIDLDSNKTILITGENGAGKTTALEAFYFVMTGKPFRKIKKDELINNINKKELYCEVEFEHESKNYLVKRGIKPNIFEIYCNDQLIDVDSAKKDYQAMLETLIGVDADTFSNTIFISSKNYTPFMKLSASEKRNFIENVLNIKIFSQMLEQLKIKRTIHKEKHSDLEFNLKNNTDKLNIAIESNTKFAANNEKEIEELKEKIEAEIQSTEDEEKELNKIDKWLNDNDFDKQLETLKQEIINEKNLNEKTLNEIESSFENQSKELNKTIKEKRVKLSEVENYYNECKFSKFEFEKELTELNNRFERELKESQKEIQIEFDNIRIDKENHIKLQTNNLKEYQTKLKFYTENSICPTCDQPIDKCNDNVSKIIENIEINIKQLTENIEKTEEFIQSKKDQLEKDLITDKQFYEEKFNQLKNEVKKKIENIEKRLNEEDIKKESINKEIDETQSKLDDLNNEKKTQINEQRARSIKNIEIIETKILPITNNLEKANKRKQEINIKIDKVNSIIKTYQDRINTLSNQEKKDLIDTKQFESEIEKYSNLIKESEYKKETIDQMIKILSDKGIKSYIVSKYVPIINELVNKYLEIFSANYRLTFDEQFDLSIHARGYEKLGYDSFSSGECQRVDMSLLFAFMELGRLKNSINTNCVFYDEITDMSMDASGIDGFVNIINSMKREGKTIFNISHRPELQDRFDKSFRVNKNMFSSLEEI